MSTVHLASYVPVHRYQYFIFLNDQNTSALTVCSFEIGALKLSFKSQRRKLDNGVQFA
jgi:hypothetical protein